MNWTGLNRTEAPRKLPVKLDIVKEYLRIDGTFEDTLLNSLIKAATTSVENHLNRSLITQEYKLTKDNFTPRFYSSTRRFPQEGVIEATKNVVEGEADFIYLPMGRVQSIKSLITYNDGNLPSTFDSTQYTLDETNDKARLVLNDQSTWPTDLRDNSAIEVNYVSGYGDTEKTVPDDIKIAITMIVAGMYENRCGDAKISPIVTSMLSSYKIYSMG